MNRKSRTRLIWISIAVAWLFDLLFWKKSPGISFFILVFATLLGGLLLARLEIKKPAPTIWILIPLTLFFAGITAFRLEESTNVFSVLMTILLMGLTAVSFLGGKWWRYSVVDYIAQGFRLIIGGITLVLILFTKKIPDQSSAENPIEQSTHNLPKSSGWAVLRGILLAIPVLLILSLLLSAADPIFESQFQEIMKALRIENIAEYLFRLGYILICAYLLGGVYLFAITTSTDEKLSSPDHPIIPPFMGIIESGIILGLVNLLFIAFVVIQFQYFFGGQANIHISGFTYSEYARRGFGELIIVAFISLLLFLGLSRITKRGSGMQARVFSGLCILLVLLVGVMLTSAYQRLYLYETAYGFTRLRILTHIFMIWLGVLLAGSLVLELTGRVRLFPLAALLTTIGFSATLGIINVDGYIVRINLERADDRKTLDMGYLTSLSEDALPVLISAYQDPTLSANQHHLAGGVLACRTYLWEERVDEASQQSVWNTWPSFHFSRAFAEHAYPGLMDILSEYPIRKNPDEGYRQVKIDQRWESCYSSVYMD